jgi:hypothetical protein
MVPKEEFKPSTSGLPFCKEDSASSVVYSGEDNSPQMNTDDTDQENCLLRFYL